ncbi:MAG: glycosyltransferase [Thermoplasmata archaeon]
MVKIFYLSQEHPLPNNPISQIFITYRVKVLNAQRQDPDLYFLEKKYGSGCAFLRKMLGKTDYQNQHLPVIRDGIKWNGVVYKFGFKELIQRKINKNKFERQSCEKIARDILSSTDFTNYDMIHCYSPYPEGYVGTLLSQKTGLPLVITCIGSDIHTRPQLNPVIRELTVAAMTKANKVIFVSNSLLDTAQKLGYSGENAVVIPNGVDLTTFTIQERESNKRELGLSGKVVGFVGNLIRVKRADMFPAIFKQIQETQKNVEFLIVGDGEFKKSIADKCKILGIRAKFMGFVETPLVPKCMNAMDVLILPSRNEGFPCVVLEAQACGVPIVGSGNGGVPEAIGDAGIIVKEGMQFEERFADAVIKAVNMKWDRDLLRRRALKFDWNVTVQKEIEIYQSVVK